MVTYSAQPPATVQRESTRDMVFDVILRNGPISAADIGKTVELTAAAVRRHVDALEEEGLVKIAAIRPHRGAGRPSRQYVVTQRGQSQLSNDYVAVTISAVETIEKLGGDEAIRQFAREYFDIVEEKFNQALPDDNDLQTRIKTLTKVLGELGFAATTRRAGRAGKVTTLRAAQICQGHCPIQELAAEFPQFCAEETDLFAKLLKVDVRRLATIPTGGHVCNTHVPLGRVAHASLVSHQANAE